MFVAVTTEIDAGLPAVPVAVNEADVPTPAVDAVKLFDPSVVLSVGVQDAIPLEFVVDAEQPEADAPVVVVAQVTVIPELTVLLFES